MGAPLGADSSQGMLASIIPATGVAPKRHAASLEASYAELPWIRAAVGKIGDGVALPEWRLWRAVGSRDRRRGIVHEYRGLGVEEQAKAAAEGAKRGDVVEVLRHPLLDLIRGGNSALTGFDQRRVQSILVDLVGEAPLVLDRNAAGVPCRGWVVPSSWCRSRPTPAQPFYRFAYRGWLRDIPEADVLWFHNPDPAQPYGRGAGVAGALADELTADEFAARYIAKWFVSGGRPELLVTAKDVPSDKDKVAEFEDKWRAKARGLLPMLLKSEQATVTQLGHTFDQQQVVDLRRFGRDLQVQVFGVPPELLGILGNSNRSTIQLAEENHAKGNLVPRLRRKRETYQRLLPEYRGAEANGILTVDSPVAQDREFELKVLRAQPHVATANEWRRMGGLPDAEGGDVHLVANRFVAWPRLEDVELRAAATADESEEAQERMASIEERLDEIELAREVSA